MHGGEPYVEYSDWVETKLEKTGIRKTCGSSDALHQSHIGVSFFDGKPWWDEYMDTSGEKWYWLDEIKDGSTEEKTQYRYRDIKTIYCYERYVPGGGEWSEWSETPFSDDDGRREVEIKKQYRYECEAS